MSLLTNQTSVNQSISFFTSFNNTITLPYQDLVDTFVFTANSTQDGNYSTPSTVYRPGWYKVDCDLNISNTTGNLPVMFGIKIRNNNTTILNPSYNSVNQLSTTLTSFNIFVSNIIYIPSEFNILQIIARNCSTTTGTVTFQVTNFYLTPLQNK